MQLKKAQRLAADWGDKPCTHPQWDRLYIDGDHVGEACTRCGKDRDDYDNELRNRKSPPTEKE